MKQVECNKCGKMFEVEGEWGYCPFCENDNVEVKKSLEEEIEMLKEHKFYADNIIKAYADKCKNYEKQLAEKEKEIQNWQTMYQSVMKSCHNGIEEDKRLREQLAERDEEILEVKNWWSYQYNGEIERHNQDKISFCIEQLEKVKELIKNMSVGIGIETYGTRIKPVEEYIDCQIEELKKEMK